MPNVEIWLVVILCFGFTAITTFAVTGAVVSAAFMWVEYQRSKIVSQLEQVRAEGQRVYRELQAEYNWLKKDHEKLLAEYMTLSALVRGGDGPDVVLNASGNLSVGELTGRDKTTTTGGGK